MRPDDIQSKQPRGDCKEGTTQKIKRQMDPHGEDVGDARFVPCQDTVDD